MTQGIWSKGSQPKCLALLGTPVSWTHTIEMAADAGARHVGVFSLYLVTTESDVIDRQERQIVQS